MAVSGEEQEKRGEVLMSGLLGALLAIPIVGDLIGMFTIAPKLYVTTFLKSQRRLVDFAIVTGLIFLFFPVAYFWLLVVDGKSTGLFLTYATRFLIVAKGLPWYYRRLEGASLLESIP